MLAAARTEKMACMAVRDEDEPMQQIGKDGMTGPQLPRTCRFYRYNYSKGEHYEHDLEQSEKYFFLLVSTTDPGSFVRVSGISSPAPRLPPPTPSSVAPAPSLHEHKSTSSHTVIQSVSWGPAPQSPRADDTDDEERNSPVGGAGVSQSPTPNLPRANGNQPPAETHVAVRERATVKASPVATTAAPAGSFSKCLSLSKCSLAYLYRIL